jgi:hypothetical protein
VAGPRFRQPQGSCGCRDGLLWRLVMQAEAGVSEHAELVRDRGLLHADVGGEPGDSAGLAAQPGQDRRGAAPVLKEPGMTAFASGSPCPLYADVAACSRTYRTSPATSSGTSRPMAPLE